MTFDTGAHPADPVTGDVPAPRRVNDCVQHRIRLCVIHDEHEQRLRQEARLEDAAAIFVRDATLPSVSNRFDDRDTNVPGLLLDRIDDDLDALSS